MNELPYETFQRLTGKSWGGGKSADVQKLRQALTGQIKLPPGLRDLLQSAAERLGSGLRLP